ncbi:MAG TPA: NAD-glutamate dehydrogenase [Rhizomicrobium sp.]|jgi:glutamate dehydrogenase
MTPDSGDSAAALHTDETENAERLGAAETVLKKANADAPLTVFFHALYANAMPEDVNRYGAEALAALARLVFTRVSNRKSGESTVTLFNPREETKDYPKNESVLIAANDDMPFLFDSLMAEMNVRGVRVRAAFHPIIPMAAGLTSVIVLVLDPVVGDERRTALIDGARGVFAQVRVAVRDWRQMLGRLHETVAALKAFSPHISGEELSESIAFLEWLGDNHFTFIGARDYAYRNGSEGVLAPLDETGLGVLAEADARVLRGDGRGVTLTPQIRAFLTAPEPLIITKSNDLSRVHRHVHMDYVGVKLFGTDGKLKGERRFVGLFTSAAYSQRPSEIPLLRLKVRRVIERAGLPTASHDGKALAHILDTFPRDELFQISDDELFATAMGILRLGGRPRVRVFVRFDRFDRFVSALVYVPRDRYDTAVRERIHAILARAFHGRTSAATPILDDSALARVHYIVGRNDGARPHVDVHQLEKEISEAIRTWDDSFLAALIAKHGEVEGQDLFHDQAQGFPPRYRDVFAPDEAVRDLDEVRGLMKTNGAVKARVYRKADDAHSALRLKLYITGNVMPLSASLPIFENLGLKVIAEDSYPVTLKSSDGWSGEAAVLDFLMERADEGPADLTEIKPALESAFHAVIAGDTESDGFNKLVIGSGLAWRDVMILRAVAKFLRQAGMSFSQDYVEQSLARNPDIARLLVELFHARNAPGQDKGRDEHTAAIMSRIDGALNDVPSLDDDRILRRMRNVIENVLRTNYYQHAHGQKSKPYMSMKLDSQKLDELPAPRPLVEIFVYSPEVEGVHLRFGKVARGGLRWSDRREDFRTEVLGLVKAQQVKNAVIVPVGSKGGFYPKQLPVNAAREAVQEAGISAYKTFVSALLDVTDNIGTDGAIVPPDHVVRHDGDDPYLVVAADKGTATFSDIANGIAEARGFWLGDAFASGGSHGYDHKKMGITAKGAWEAVKRHFREMGRDIQNEPFTVAGVGDMSGDVFGNGMLLSKHIRLVAAFDHRHIFIDPNPDEAKSWAERQRMFDLPRSSWADYDKSLISQGGGVFPRTAKEIPLSDEMKALTGLSAAKATPVEVMRAILKADVDLLWFGGIGTYIKASSQNNLDAGDRTNDALRIDGREIRAKVVGEGANLGCTQLGRVEYAQAGGRIDTDAIDNSAGVDTSDHEVNLKILVSGPVRRKEITMEERDVALADVTDEVAAHVLMDNYDQTLALSVAQQFAVRDLDAHSRFMRDLERRGKLDRAVEFLPDEEELRRRAQASKGLTRPELSVLLAYAKLDLFAETIGTDLPDDPHFLSTLASYFPEALAKRFPDEMEHHRLRREIIATVLANRIVNLGGPTFVYRMKESSGTGDVKVARAFVVADGGFGLSALKARIDALDGKIEANIQTSMYGDIAELLRRLGLWFLANIPADANLADSIAMYRAGVEALRGTFATLVSPYEAQDTEARIKQLQDAGAPLDVAEDVAVLPLLSAAPEIAQLAHVRHVDIDLVAGAYFEVGEIVGLDRLRGLAARITASEHWDRLAIRRIVDDLFAGQRALTAKVLAQYEHEPVDRTRIEGIEAAKRWAADNADALDRAKAFFAELERTGDLTMAKLTLANSQVHELAGK